MRFKQLHLFSLGQLIQKVIVGNKWLLILPGKGVAAFEC